MKLKLKLHAGRQLVFISENMYWDHAPNKGGIEHMAGTIQQMIIAKVILCPVTARGYCNGCTMA